jgi:hypothetical protein
LQRTVSDLNKNRIPILGIAVKGLAKFTEGYHYPYLVKFYQPVLEKPVKSLVNSFSPKKNY